jgi:hypothetical protein
MKKKKVKLLSPTDVLALWMALGRDQQHSANARKYAKMAGMKSIAEIRCAAWLERNNIKYDYESERWTYQYEVAHYTPDFVIPGKEFVLEVKGKMTKDIRKKLLAIQKCNPNKTFYIVFERASNKIAPGSKTTYGLWAEKNGIQWSEVLPREEWFNGAKRKRKANNNKKVSVRRGRDEVGGTCHPCR